MATTSMSSKGYRDILVREGFHPPVTMIENGGVIFPGYVVTTEGETYPDVAKPDAKGDTATGVAGLKENQDIDTVYADNSEIPIYLCGSGAIVKCYFSLNGGDCTMGEILVSQGLEDTGHVESWANAIKDSIAAGHDAFTSVWLTQVVSLYALVGRAMETVASTGTTVPIKVLLSI